MRRDDFVAPGAPHQIARFIDWLEWQADRHCEQRLQVQRRETSTSLTAARGTHVRAGPTRSCRSSTASRPRCRADLIHAGETCAARPRSVRLILGAGWPPGRRGRLVRWRWFSAGRSRTLSNFPERRTERVAFRSDQPSHFRLQEFQHKVFEEFQRKVFEQFAAVADRFDGAEARVDARLMR